LLGAACRFELTDEGLSWHVAGRAGMWPYASITKIRLSYRPISMQSRRFRADISGSQGRAIPVISVTWQSAALVAPQDDPYRSFIARLHERIAQADGKPMLLAGLKPIVYNLGLIAVALVGISMLGLFVRAAMVGSYAGMLFLVGFAALFGWQIGGFLMRNKPRIYTLDGVPADLLP
jgi:hypothetical protein